MEALIEPRIKTCAVPCCHSNTRICPEKIFIQVPEQPDMRYIWFQRAKTRRYLTQSHIYFCEDHFEIPKTYNVELMPTKFECQYFWPSERGLHLPCIKKSAMNDPEKLNTDNSVLNTDITLSCQSQPRNKKSAKNDPEELYNTDKSLLNTDITLSSKSNKKLNKKGTNAIKKATLSLLKKENLKVPSILKKVKSSKCPYSNEGIYNKTKKYNKKSVANKEMLVKFIIREHDYAEDPHKECTKKECLAKRTCKEKRTRPKKKSVKIKKHTVVIQSNEHKIQKEIDGSPETTDSAESFKTFKCYFCKIEFILENDFSGHLQKVHLLSDFHEMDESTESAKSIVTYKCYHCKTEFVDKSELLSHIQEQHIVIGDDTLDIKPEIFQCSKCPSSFLNAVEMSNHLGFMHGDIDFRKQIQKLKRLNSPSHHNENSNDNIRKEINSNSRSDDNLFDCNLREFITNVDIKREYDDPLEDIDFSMENNHNLGEQNQVFNQMDLDQILYDNQCKLNEDADWTTDAPPAIEISRVESLKFKDKKFNSNNEEYEYTLSKNVDGYQRRFLEYLTSANNEISNHGPGVTHCKTCKTIFLNHEELLDHIHDVFNTKTKLYADAKKALKTDSVKFKNPFAPRVNGVQPYLNEAELLNYIHKVYNKTRTDQLQLQVVRYYGNEEYNNPVNDTTRKCRCCSKRLPKMARVCNKDKICTKCRKMQINYEGRKFSTAKLYASAKNMLFQCQDRKSGEANKVTPDQFGITNTAIKEETLLDGEGNGCYLSETVKTSVEMLEADSQLSFGDNDLLTPLREENETVLVEFDKNLCKSCLKPLNNENCVVCKKCRTLEYENDKRKQITRRMSIERRRVSSGSKNDNFVACHICNIRFVNKFHLKEHVTQAHM